jgi:hypothetical protein
MPKVEFTTDLTTGRAETHIGGIAGSACETEARQLRELLGAPAREDRTAEYAQQTARRRIVRSQRSGTAQGEA